MSWVVSSVIITHHTPPLWLKSTFCGLFYMCSVCPVRCKVHTHILRYYLRRPGNILSQSGEHTTQSHYNPPHYWGGLSQGRPHSISITGTQCGGNVVGGREQAEHGQRQRAALSFHSSYLPHLMPSITPHSTLLVPQECILFPKWCNQVYTPLPRMYCIILHFHTMYLTQHYHCVVCSVPFGEISETFWAIADEFESGGNIF